MGINDVKKKKTEVHRLRADIEYRSLYQYNVIVDTTKKRGVYTLSIIQNIK